MNTAKKIAPHELNTASENPKNNIKESLFIVPKTKKRLATTVLEIRVLAYLSEIFSFPIDNLLDNFLELGGGSLKAAQLITHLKENGYKASMEDLFSSKNLAAFVARVECGTML